MTNFEKMDIISEKIINQAKEEAEELINRAKNNAGDIIEKARKKAEDIKKIELKQRNDYIEESNRQKIAEIKVQNHIRMQTFKSGLIEKTFSEAKEKLEDYYQKEEYLQILNNLIVQAGSTLNGGELIIRLNKKDKDIITQKKLKMLSEKIRDVTNKDTELIIGKEDLNTIGGVIISLKNQKASIDNTFRNLLEETKDKAKTEIERILF